MMLKRINLLIILLLSFIVFDYQAIANDDITPKELKKHVKYLSSDRLEGRKPGTKGEKLAARYIKKQFRRNRLKLFGSRGLQKLDILTDIIPSADNSLEFRGTKCRQYSDFIPVSFSGNSSLSAQAVFVGYGFDIDSKDFQWESYEGINIKDKWAIILIGEPKVSQRPNPFSGQNSLRSKALRAKAKGAAGVIFVSGPRINKEDNLEKLNIRDAKISVDFPVIQITRRAANSLIRSALQDIDEIENEIHKSFEPAAFYVSDEITSNIKLEKVYKPAMNVIGIMKGSDPILRDEYIVVGAHFDHLGYGGPGSGSRMKDTIAVHNGADDNASGVATMLEIIQKFAKERKEIKRSIIFAAFTAEEIGLLGSSKFVENPPVALGKIKFMINFDMIGRIDSSEKNLNISGTGTAAGLVDIIEKSNENNILKLNLNTQGFGPGDQSSFYAKDIPVLSFYGDPHADYHTPFDDFDKLNYGDLAEAGKIAANIIINIANLDSALTFKEAGPKEGGKSSRANMKVSLGIMPDFAAKDIVGLRAKVVMPNKPAAIAGMMNNDIIKKIEGDEIKDIYDYMEKMSEFRAGDRINVDIIRDGKAMILIIEL